MTTTETHPRTGRFQQLARQYVEVRSATEELCLSLTPEDHLIQSMPDASPTKWHLAHTSWFFETFLLTPRLSGYRPLDPEYRQLFNSYYNSVGERPLKQLRGTFSRPSVDEVMAYRLHVNEAMLLLLQADLSEEVRELVELGLNHEQQHQELIVTDIKHALWNNPQRPSYGHRMRPEGVNAGALEWHGYDEGIYSIGHEGEAFAFDNESPRHKVYLQAFSLASRLTTCGEYLAFMDAGGYIQPEHWLSDGWEVCREQKWQAPLYWEKDGRGDWWQYSSRGIERIDEHSPVCHVSLYEADAFARWSEARLPTEAEWEIAAEGLPIEGNFQESGNFHPIAIEALGRKPRQMFGDVWEWTQSAYSAYPGYRPVKGALGEYNAKFMCNQMVLRGGSCATPQSHIRASYRNFFPPHARWQFSGIRLAR